MKELVLMSIGRWALLTRLSALLLLCGKALLADEAAGVTKPPASDPPAANALSETELAAGWILLFDGETTYGWTQTAKANWTVADGSILVTEGQPGFLRTTSEFGNYELSLEFKAAAKTNSGVFLAMPTDPKNPASDCYEVNIANDAVSPFATGSLVQRQKAESVEPCQDQWRMLHATVLAGEVNIAVDGKPVCAYKDSVPLGRGFIGLQFNVGLVAFRNIKLKPLALQPLFNGLDLTGWKQFEGKRGKFAVTDKHELRVTDGDGQLESEARFADFTLQFECLSNGKHLNSGIFFRSIPGQFWQGYESQIQNGFKDGDRSQPLDCGTGGFYRRQNARRVVSDDFVWFRETLCVSGPRMAAWINGIQVSDWTDERPKNENPRQGLRLEAGTFIIQSHDKTTDLSFRNLRAAEMARRASAANSPSK